MADKNMEAQISVEFEEATSRQSLNSGETINTLWGKVKRWLSDLKAVAFSGDYNDLENKPDALPANGGNADRISNVTIDDIFHSVGLNAISDIDNTDGNWSLSAITVTGEISGTFPPSLPVWAVINQYQTSIGKDFKIQTCQSIEGDARLWIRSKWNQSEVWGDWVDVYAGSNKPYVTGSATVAANSTTCTPNHGFMPSGVIWWDVYASGIGLGLSETSFNMACEPQSVNRTVNYIIFK